MYQRQALDNLDQLVDQYAVLVKRIASHMMARLPHTVALEDLIQAGMIGLIEAARKYDVSKGASFETYAGIRIKGAMVDEIRKGDWAPRSVHRNTRKISDAIRQIENRTGRDASDAEVAETLGISQDEYHAMLQDTHGTRLFNFSELIQDEEDEFAESRLRDESSPEPSQTLETNSFQQSLAREIAELPERERLVLALYYDEELNLKEIGAVLGVSESRVSQIHSQAAFRLRARLSVWS